MSTTSPQRIAFPLYFVPDVAGWNQLLQTVNGTSPLKYLVLSSDYQVAMTNNPTEYRDHLRTAQGLGIKVLGYVATGSGFGVFPFNQKQATTEGCYYTARSVPYSATTTTQIISDVTNWYILPQPSDPNLVFTIDGIFYDEGPCFTPAIYGDPSDSSTQQKTFDAMRVWYNGLYSFARSKGAKTVLLNASGCLRQEYSWLINDPVCDAMVLWEADVNDKHFPYLTTSSATLMPTWTAGHEDQMCHVIYNVPDSATMQQVVTKSKQLKVGCIYTFDGTSSAYNHIPPYWNDEQNAVI